MLLLTRKWDLVFPSAKEEPFLFIPIDLGVSKHVAFINLLTVSEITFCYYFHQVSLRQNCKNCTKASFLL